MTEQDRAKIKQAVAHWEAVPDDPHPDDVEGGRFWRVRWSESNDKGEHLYVRGTTAAMAARGIRMPLSVMLQL